MSLLPTAKKPLKLLGPRKPNYSDYQGPADGDYVRYVQELMDWAEQEQTRQRLQAARQVSRAPATDWGRSSAQPATQPARRAQAVNTGAVAASNPLQQLARWAQKTSSQLPAQLQSALDQAQTQAGSTAAQPASKKLRTDKPEPGMAPLHKAAPVVLMAVVGLLVVLGAAHLIPIAIVVFVGYHLTRSIRGANADKPKP